jgi:hypothetical protein
MPLTWTIPRTDALFGPGYQLSVQSSLIGPFPTTYQWRVQVYSTDGLEAQLIDQSLSAFSAQQTLTMVLADPTILQQDQRGSPVNVTPSSTVRLIVDLINEVGQRIDGDTRNVKWDPTGRLFVFTEDFAQGTTGGFNANDRAEAETTQMAVQANFPTQIGAVGDLVLGLGDLVEHIGVQLVVPSDEILISGRGSLERPSGPISINAYGLTWRFVTLPAGLGFRDGAVATFYDRVLQLVRVDVDRASNEYLGEVFDIRTEGGRIVWGFGIPRRLLYDVLPGCVVGVRWLLL